MIYRIHHPGECLSEVIFPRVIIETMYHLEVHLKMHMEEQVCAVVQEARVL
jgi:hypothetical protein